MSVILVRELTAYSDLADAFPNGDFREYFRHEFLTTMARETRANADFSVRTRDTARWAREQIKRQSGTSRDCDLEFLPSCTLTSHVPFIRLVTNYLDQVARKA